MLGDVLGMGSFGADMDMDMDWERVPSESICLLTADSTTQT